MLFPYAFIRGSSMHNSPTLYLKRHTILQLSLARHPCLCTRPITLRTLVSLRDTRDHIRSSRRISSASSYMALTQKRGHGGHSHSHHHDNTYLTSANKKDPGVRITRIGLFVNLAMAIGKGIGGYVFHSQALIADAFHALTDLVSDLMTLGTVSWSLKLPTERFPYGYGKIESLGALGVSGLLLFGGIGMGANALDLLYTQAFLDSLHDHHHRGIFTFLGHDHSHASTLPDLNAAWLAGGSILVKEWLYRSTMKIAKGQKSAVLASNAVHHRVDSLTSIVALATIGGAHLVSDASWLDPVGGLIISAMVIKAGWSNTMSSLLELADVGVDDEIRKVVHEATTKALIGDPSNTLPGVIDGRSVTIGRIQGVKSGQNYLMDIQLMSPGKWNMEKAHTIEETVRKAVGSKVRGVKTVRLRFVPRESSDQDFSNESIGANANSRGSPEPGNEHISNHQHGPRQHAEHPQNLVTRAQKIE